MARYVGTGADPRYPKGVVVDVDYDGDEPGPLARGWVEELPGRDDPGRTPYQLAQAVARNDLLTDPEDRAAAVEAGFIVEHEGTSTYTATAKAYTVAGDEPAEETEPEPARRRRASG